MTIDGTSGQGYLGTPVVAIDGNGAGASANGLTIRAAGTAINALAIGGFGGAGIEIDGPGGDVVQGCYIGTDFSGREPIANGGAGVSIVNSPLNTIGGSTFLGVGPNGAPGVFSSANLISANIGSGVSIRGPGSAGNQILMDSIGLDSTGQSALGNGGDGITVDAAIGTLIGSGAVIITGPDLGSTISGNIGSGIHILNGATGTQIRGNLIGTDGTGTAAFGNLSGGVVVEDSPSNSVGGPIAGYSDPLINVISGNFGAGVRISGAAAIGNLVVGDLIGVDRTGTVGIGNLGSGVAIAGAPNTTIGGAAGNANVVSGNAGSGIAIQGSESTGTLVVGNDVGVDVTGGAVVGNGLNGIFIFNSSFVTVGGTTAPERNVISGNQTGVVVGGGQAMEDVIQGNAIGTDATETVSLGNLDGGIVLEAQAESSGGGTPNQITIGGVTAGSGNVVSGNTGTGIDVTGMGTNSNLLAGNVVGLDVMGRPMGNTGDGILIEDGAANNTIGGLGSGRNLVSSNLGSGIELIGGSGNLVVNSFVGTDPTGTQARPNRGAGVLVESPGNTVGGPIGSLGNLISGNGLSGIDVTNGGADTLVIGNLIGVDATGSVALPNHDQGIAIVGTPGVTIGGTSLPLRNIVSGETYGIFIEGTTAVGDVVQGNFIGTDVSGNREIPNLVSGVYIHGDSLADGVARGTPTRSTIGGMTVGAGNLISGNNEIGVQIDAVEHGFHLVVGNVIGLSISGASLGNHVYGIAILSATGNTIGAAGSGRNVISGNLRGGIFLNASTDNLIVNNLVGTNETGTASRPNGIAGITILASENNTVGGGVGLQNYLSGNDGSGLSFDYQASGNLIVGDVIGLDISGYPLGNQGDGILFGRSSTGNQIGLAGGKPNVISGNGGNGVDLQDGPANIFANNLVGTDPTGFLPRSNQLQGFLVDSPGNTIGGATTGERNLISGNGLDGVEVRSSDTVIRGNLIGTTLAGDAPLPNGENGIEVDAPSTGATIGGTAVTGNLVSGNVGNGILIHPTDGKTTSIVNNRIGTDASGEHAVPNGSNGIAIVGASGITIGGPTSGAGNLVSGNVGDGILVAGASGNLIASNAIGTDLLRLSPIGNGAAGIDVQGSPGTTIGGLVATGNLVAASGGLGISVGPSGSGGPLGGIVVAGNLVGTNGSALVGLGNRGGGVLLSRTSAASISGNVVSGNVGAGLTLDASTAATIVNNKFGTDATLRAALPNSGDGLVLADGSTGNRIGGLDTYDGNNLTGNGGNGLSLRGGSSGNLIEGNTIGVGADGLRIPNGGDGIGSQGSANTIGGNAAAAGNLIGGNRGGGIRIVGGGASLVVGNAVGTDPTGIANLGNAGDGIRLEAASGSTISGNVVEANGHDGVAIAAGSEGALIVGNQIGQDDGPLGNSGNGILIDASANATIGGTTPAASNAIVSNAGGGIVIQGGAAGTMVLGNSIGLDRRGRAGHGNADGVVILGSPGTAIMSNLIGSNGIGVNVAGSGSTGTVISANLIGVAANGLDFAGNATDGIFIDDAPGVVVEDNVISGNGVVGVQASGTGASGTVIRGNRIGTDAGGTIGRGNGLVGVFINGAPGSSVGGADAAMRNLIDGNGSVGLQIVGAGAAGTTVEGNWIGLDATGLRPIGNGLDGILLEAPGVTIGGLSPGARNVVSGNGSVGIDVATAAASGNAILGNWVGLDATGLAAVGNGVLGLIINGASGNVVGGNGPGSGNVITGSGSVDVEIAGSSASGNVVAGDLIGTDATGLAGLAAAPNGIFINAAPNNLIGGTSPGAGNVIGGHAAVGIEIFSRTASGNSIFGNQIGPGTAGAASLRNGLGILIVNAPRNVVGGRGTGMPNTIVGNGADVIRVTGVLAVGNATAGNIVRARSAGRDAAGRTVVGPLAAPGNRGAGGRRSWGRPCGPASRPRKSANPRSPAGPAQSGPPACR